MTNIRSVGIVSIGHCFSSTRIDNRDELEKCVTELKDFNIEKTTHFVDDIYGKRYKYELDPSKESILSMAITAAKRCLDKVKVNPKEIDMLIFSGMIPETYTPPTSVLLHHELGLRDDVSCIDTNGNCVGMLINYMHTAIQMQTDKNVRKCLIVDSEYLTAFDTPDNMLSRMGFTDSALALLLEASHNSTQSGILDYTTYVNSEQRFVTYGPHVGYTKLAQDCKKQNMIMDMTNPDCELHIIVDRIHSLLHKNGYTINDIQRCYFSQMIERNISYLIDNLPISRQRVTYIGRECGYTGAGSPFLALEYDLENDKVHSGDLCLFWTVGAGLQQTMVLAKI